MNRLHPFWNNSNWVEGTLELLFNIIGTCLGFWTEGGDDD